MALTDINSEGRLVQQTFADHLHRQLGRDTIHAFHHNVFLVVSNGDQARYGRMLAR